MKNRFRKFSFLLALIFLLCSVFSGISLAADEEFEYVDNANSPNTINDKTGFKLDDWKYLEDNQPTEFVSEDEDITITITVTESKDGNENIKFDFSSDQPIYYVAVKGGNGYNLYTYDPPVESGSGLVTPINESGTHAGISHITFYYDPDYIPPVDPWEQGQILVEKIISGDPREANEEFEIELYLDGVKIGDSQYVKVGKPIIFTGLEAGTYRIVEKLTSAQDDYYEMSIEIEDILKPATTQDNGDEVSIYISSDKESGKFIVTNTKESVTPDPDPEGKIKVKKIVQNNSGESLLDNNTKFFFDLYKEVEENMLEIQSRIEGNTWMFQSRIEIEGNGIDEFDKLYDGNYKVVEVDIDSDFYLHSDNDLEVSINNESTVEVEFVNRLKPTIPPGPDPDPEGKIRVAKIVQTRGGTVINGNRTRFYFELYKENEDGKLEYVETKSIVGNGTDEFTELEDGIYEVREVNINSSFRLSSRNNLEVEIVESSEEDIQFINVRRPDITPDPDPDPEYPEDPKDPEDQKDTDPTTPEESEAPRVEDPVVKEEIEEEVPGGTPEEEVEIDEEEEEEIEEEEEVIEEEVPSGPTLPKTGDIPTILYYSLGTIMIGLGIGIGRKKEK